MRISDWSSDVCSSDLGASDVLVAEARLDREYPGGPIRGRFAARHGPDGLLLGRFALRTNAATGLDAMPDEAVKRIDEIYANALRDGRLGPAPSLKARRDGVNGQRGEVRVRYGGGA